MKKFIATLCSQRVQRKEIELTTLKSILLKPIGHAVGDSIVHLMHIMQIKNAFPQAKIGVFVTERNRAIYENANIIDELIEDHFSGYLSQRGKWELYLDFFPSFTTKSIILDAILKPKYVINFGKRDKKHYNLATVKNYDYAVEVPELTHFKEYLMYSPLASYLSPVANYYLKISNEAKEKVTKFWKNTNTVKILLNPQGSTRFLPAEELTSLLENVKYANVEYLMTNTAGSEAYFAKLPQLDNLRLAPKTSLFEYFALIDSADIVVAVDGGGVHIACACGKPLLAFYSNNEQTLHKWAPSPKEKVNCLTLIGKHEASDNNGTTGFNMTKAAEWLNDEILNITEQ